MKTATNSIEVRVALPSDSSAVTQLLRVSYPSLMKHAYAHDVLAAALPLMTTANPGLLASGTYYVACAANGIIIGCGGWTKSVPGTGENLDDAAHLRQFATHPAAARLGIGRRIAERCIAGAAAASVRKLLVYSSLNAESFYASLGMRRVRVLDLQLAPGVAIPGVLMERGLP